MKSTPCTLCAIAKRLDVNPCAVGIGGRGRKRVVVDAAQHFFRGLRRVQGNVTAFAKDCEAQRSKIIKAENMIGVPVRVENSVHASQSAAQSLLAEVWTGIDDHDPFPLTFVPSQQ